MANSMFLRPVILTRLLMSTPTPSAPEPQQQQQQQQHVTHRYFPNNSNSVFMLTLLCGNAVYACVRYSIDNDTDIVLKYCDRFSKCLLNPVKYLRTEAP